MTLTRAEDPDGRTALGIDVGGTKIAALRVDAAGRVLAREIVPTPADDQQATLAAMADAGRAVASRDTVAVGISAAGLVTHPGGVMRYAPNLVWRDADLPRAIGGELGLPAVAENDANAAAWGEYRVGGEGSLQHLLFVTVGTGIGGGIVSDGRLVRGAHGFAAEIGHIVVEPDGPICGCGNHGCWETVASGSAITRLARGAVRADPASAIGVLAGGDPAAATGRMATEAAAKGDAAAAAIITEVGTRLGTGIAGLVNILDPEAVIVGGGASAIGEPLLAPARAAFRAAVEAGDVRPDVPITAARLGNDAGAIGAALLALEAFGSGS